MNEDYSFQRRAITARQRPGHRGGKYPGSNFTLDLDRTVGQGAVHGIGDRRPEGDCRGGYARKIRQYADSFF